MTKPCGPMRGQVGILCVDPQCILQIWPHVRGLLRKAQIGNGYLFDEPQTLFYLQSGRSLLWIVYEAGSATLLAAATTRLYRVPDGLICELSSLGGTRMREWLPFIQVVEKYARDEGCVRVKIEGRRGWQRKLLDYRPVGVILEKAL